MSHIHHLYEKDHIQYVGHIIGLTQHGTMFFLASPNTLISKYCGQTDSRIHNGIPAHMSADPFISHTTNLLFRISVSDLQQVIVCHTYACFIEKYYKCFGKLKNNITTSDSNNGTERVSSPYTVSSRFLTD